MNKKIFLFTLLLLITASCGFQPNPDDGKQTLFNGITYSHEIRTSPRPMRIHILRINLQADGIGVLVTPGNPAEELPLKALTTSQFLKQYRVQVAINGDAFTPWHSNTILDYYPHAGDKIKPTGFAASRGIQYAQDTNDEPTLYFSRTNQVQFNDKIGNLYNAISGTKMLVKNGQIEPGLESDPEPRTALALSKSAKELILIVVDGRQKGFSEGATLQELAQIILSIGGQNGMNLDGGGSSTMVVETTNGESRVLNSPINNEIPGRERDVGNHLGIFASQVGAKSSEESKKKKE